MSQRCLCGWHPGASEAPGRNKALKLEHEGKVKKQTNKKKPTKNCHPGKSNRPDREFSHQSGKIQVLLRERFALWFAKKQQP